MNTPQPPRVSGGPTFAVRFIRPWHSYYPGDCATFPARDARSLVARRYAERINMPDGPPPEGGQFALRYPTAQVNKGP
ncbi:MAG TPA: hypothetical protein VLN57_19410 [Xanthobacteraceae bacterium]|nr:hypothetical protein [Xanthobacteraceae bacterium]